MPDKRSSHEHYERYIERRQAFLLRNAAREEIRKSSFFDRDVGELICRTSRSEIIGGVAGLTSAGTAVCLSEVPDVVHGEVLEDSYGRGTFQRVK